MNVFITGSTGYIGRRVARRLVAAGHDVVGLVRPKPNSPLQGLEPGVRPLPGTLEDLGTSVRDAIATADAIVHTAFPHHGAGWATAVAIEAEFLRRVVDTLSGSNRPIVVSNGTIFLGDSSLGRLSEEAPVVAGHPRAIRAHAIDVVVRSGLRAIELRLASFVYGHGGSVFLPALLAHARSTGQSVQVGEGSVRASAVHVDAAADAYVLALDTPTARGTFHIASDEEPTLAQIAHAVAIATSSSVVSLTQAEAAARIDPFTALFLATDNRLTSRRARTELGWSHAGFPPLLWDLAHGSYATSKGVG